jgi:hemerythrin-like domain-containing protein
MTAIEILKGEHRVIEQMLDCLQKLASDSVEQGRIDVDVAPQMIQFFRTFADGCHHAKEEAHLFPLMESHGFQRQGGPTGVMMREHEEGRSLLRAMESALDSPTPTLSSVAEFANSARAYIQLLRDHISKEEHCLFVMADVALTPVEQQGLVEAFDHVEHHDLETGTHEKFLRLANDLVDHFGLDRSVAAQTCGSCGHH